MPAPLPGQRCALTAPFHPWGAVLFKHCPGLFLLHCPWSRLRRVLSGALPCDARTFLMPLAMKRIGTRLPGLLLVWFISCWYHRPVGAICVLASLPNYTYRTSDPQMVHVSAVSDYSVSSTASAALASSTTSATASVASTSSATSVATSASASSTTASVASASSS